MAERMVDPEANAPEEDIDDVLKPLFARCLMKPQRNGSRRRSNTF